MTMQQLNDAWKCFKCAAKPDMLIHKKKENIDICGKCWCEEVSE